MFNNNISILAIQEPTSAERTFTKGETTSIQKHCDKWEVIPQISQYQIILISKHIMAYHRLEETYMDGRVILNIFQIDHEEEMNLISTYGIPHSFHKSTSATDAQNKKRINLTNALDQILKNKTETRKTHPLTYVHGDLQDTPDNSKLFHYGKCRMPKQAHGIIKTCEKYNMECIIYKFVHQMPHPIISRHGTAGGRFIDGCYTTTSGIDKVIALAILTSDAVGISSDHDMVLFKLDLGIMPHTVAKEYQEKIDYNSVVNIPMNIKKGEVHPTLNQSTFKGTNFEHQAKLYHKLQ